MYGFDQHFCHEIVYTQVLIICARDEHVLYVCFEGTILFLGG